MGPDSARESSPFQGLRTICCRTRRAESTDSRCWTATGPFPGALRVQAPLEGRLQSDQALQFLPWMRYAAAAWAVDGELPLWKATANCGAPLLGNGQSALLFPPHALPALMSAIEYAW